MTGRRAILIGIDRYGGENDIFPSLSACVNDALAMQRALVKAGAFAAEEIALLTDPPQPGGQAATRAGILQELVGVYDLGEPLDRLLVFFSGHGLSITLGRGLGELSTVLVCGGCTQVRNSGDMIILDKLAKD